MSRTATPLRRVSRVRKQHPNIPPLQLGKVASMTSASNVHRSQKREHDADREVLNSSSAAVCPSSKPSVRETPRTARKVLSRGAFPKSANVCDRYHEGKQDSQDVVRYRSGSFAGTHCSFTSNKRHTPRILTFLSKAPLHKCEHSRQMMREPQQHRSGTHSQTAFEIAPKTCTGLQTDELDVGNQPFDPADPVVKSKMCQALGIELVSIIEGKRTVGGCNEGVWFLNGVKDKLVLKLVRSTAMAAGMPSEAECYRRLQRMYPSIVSDPALGFPHHIFRIIHNVSHAFDLIVMRQLPGRTLSEWMQGKWREGQKQRVFLCLEDVGRALARFQNRYGVDHGDMQPMNVLYDDASNNVSFIDLGSMGGVSGSHAVESDLDHFAKSVVLMSERVGQDLKKGIDYFRRGHQQAATVGSFDAAVTASIPATRLSPRTPSLMRTNSSLSTPRLGCLSFTPRPSPQIAAGIPDAQFCTPRPCASLATAWSAEVPLFTPRPSQQLTKVGSSNELAYKQQTSPRCFETPRPGTHLTTIHKAMATMVGAPLPRHPSFVAACDYCSVGSLVPVICN